MDNAIALAQILKHEFNCDKNAMQKIIFYTHCVILHYYNQSICQNLFKAHQNGPFCEELNIKYDELDDVAVEPLYLIDLEILCEAIEKVSQVQGKDFYYGKQWKDKLNQIYSDDYILNEFPSTREEEEVFNEYKKLKDDYLLRQNYKQTPEELDKIEKQLAKVLDKYTDEEVEAINKKAMDRIRELELLSNE